MGLRLQWELKPAVPMKAVSKAGSSLAIDRPTGKFLKETDKPEELEST